MGRDGWIAATVVFIFFGLLLSGCAGCLNSRAVENAQLTEQNKQLKEEIGLTEDAKKAKLREIKNAYKDASELANERVAIRHAALLAVDKEYVDAKKKAREDLKDEWDKLEREKTKVQEKIIELVTKERNLKVREDKLIEGESEFAKKKAPTELLENIKHKTQEYFNFNEEAQRELAAFPPNHGFNFYMRRDALSAQSSKLYSELKGLLAR